MNPTRQILADRIKAAMESVINSGSSCEVNLEDMPDSLNCGQLLSAYDFVLYKNPLLRGKVRRSMNTKEWKLFICPPIPTEEAEASFMARREADAALEIKRQEKLRKREKRDMEIRRLLLAGHQPGIIAKKVGVTRQTVVNVSGRDFDHRLRIDLANDLEAIESMLILIAKGAA